MKQHLSDFVVMRYETEGERTESAVTTCNLFIQEFQLQEKQADLSWKTEAAIQKKD